MKKKIKKKDNAVFRNDFSGGYFFDYLMIRGTVTN